MYFYSYPLRKLELNFGLFSNAKLIFHGLAFHVIFDSKLNKIFFLFAIPNVFTFLLTLPLPSSRLGDKLLAGGHQMQVGYGIWHDFCETKIQWRKASHSPPNGFSWEWRWLHVHEGVGKSSTYSFINSLIEKDGDDWARYNGYTSWSLLCSTRIKRSKSLFIPNLYLCYVILKAETANGKTLQSSIRLRPNYHNDITPLFDYLKDNTK